MKNRGRADGFFRALFCLDWRGKMDKLQLGQGMPKICIPIVERTEAGILGFAEKLRDSVADIVEWRADYFEEMDKPGAVQKLCMAIKEKSGGKPLLFTIRTVAEGGEAALFFEEYATLLKAVAVLPEVSYIDVEIYSKSRGLQDREAWKEPDSSCHDEVRLCVQELKENVCVIGSYHDFAQTPSQEEMIRRLVNSCHLGADIPKLAVMPHSKADVMALMMAAMQAKDLLGSAPLIAMSMGKLGKISRVAGESFGSALTFGCIGKASAPGQIEADILKQSLQMLH